MTREEANKALPILQAFAEGKVIQMLDDRSIWTDLTEREGLPIGTLRESPNIFRIKPESKYRLFKNKDKCWQVNYDRILFDVVCLPKGSIKKLIGIDLSFY